MSSSVFYESNSNSAAQDGNLVIVCSKNGMRISSKEIQTLIDEKTLSSISVMRLGSPTPSMLDEEEVIAEEEQMFRRQLLSSDEEENESIKLESAASLSDAPENTSEEEHSQSEQESSAESEGVDDETDEDEDNKTNKTNSRKTLRKKQQRKLELQTTKVRSEQREVCGLRVEHFYESEHAEKIAKEILRFAGVSTLKPPSAEVEFKIFVIANDHCYTPFKSPTEKRKHLAALGIEAKKRAAAARNSPHLVRPNQQLSVQKKPIQNQPANNKTTAVTVKQQEKPAANRSTPLQKPAKVDLKDPLAIEEKAKTDEANSSEEVEFLSDWEDKDEEDTDEQLSDNDRASDEDFKLNENAGRAQKLPAPLRKQPRVFEVPKMPAAKQRDATNTTSINKQVLLSPANNAKMATPMQRIIKVMPAAQARLMKPLQVSQVKLLLPANTKVMHQRPMLSPAIAALPPIPKKQHVATSSTPQQYIVAKPKATSSPVTVRKGPVVQMRQYMLPRAAIKQQQSTQHQQQPQPQKQQQNVNEIVINKVNKWHIF